MTPRFLKTPPKYQHQIRKRVFSGCSPPRWEFGTQSWEISAAGPQQTCPPSVLSQLGSGGINAHRTGRSYPNPNGKEPLQITGAAVACKTWPWVCSCSLHQSWAPGADLAQPSLPCDSRQLVAAHTKSSQNHPCQDEPGSPFCLQRVFF